MTLKRAVHVAVFSSAFFAVKVTFKSSAKTLWATKSEGAVVI